MSGFLLLPAARRDTAGIWPSSYKTFGAARADRYIDSFDPVFRRIADGKAVTIDWSDVAPGLVSAACGSHLVFVRTDGDEPPEIVAVLHERMDHEARLRLRL